MDKGKRIESEDGEIPLPEAMIQHIQSFLCGLVAARTIIVSKSWYNAWLTCPSLNVDDTQFDNGRRELSDVFDEFAAKTIQRYQDLSLKIDSLKLRSRCYFSQDIARNFIVNAMKIGAINVELNLLRSNTLPREVLGSGDLLKLSLSYCKVDKNYVVSCSRLKTLTLAAVELTSDSVLKAITTCCVSMEELSLTDCTGFTLTQMNAYELHKLTSLLLCGMDVDSSFFTNFASRFPCLKNLIVDFCKGFPRIHIVSTSLETISFKLFKESWKCRAKFDVPNIRKFTCLSGKGLPALSINGALREWDLQIYICCERFHNLHWFLSLKKLLAKFRLSRTSLYIHLDVRERGRSEHEVDVEVVPKPLVVESLMIDAPPTFCAAFLVRLFGIFRPKFVTHHWVLAAKRYHFWSDDVKEELIHMLCKRLMHQVITPNSGIPDQCLLGQFKLKKVNMEVYEMIQKEWRPLVLKTPLDASETSVHERKVRFELFWV